jgi:hypothetical protein
VLLCLRLPLTLHLPLVLLLQADVFSFGMMMYEVMQVSGQCQLVTDSSNPCDLLGILR